MLQFFFFFFLVESMAECRVAVVTGSNKGIGLAIVRGLCRQFAGDVYLTSRDEDRGQKAIDLLRSEGLSPKYHQLDITSDESVAALKAFLLERYGGVDVLVNNAGVAYTHASTASAVEQATNTVATNFTGTLNMLRVFTPIVKSHGRVVNVSSYHPGLFLRLTKQELRDQFTRPDLTEEDVLALKEKFLQDVKDGVHHEQGWCNTFYSSSKTLETAMMLIYNRKLQDSAHRGSCATCSMSVVQTVSHVVIGKGSGYARGKEDVLMNACCPGWVKTDMAGDKAPLTPDQGAETPIMCALLPQGSPTGAFWKEKELTEV